ncbi:MAG TPA: neutral/alkaline non-lysosomal ceramidase N-terminal domain-containing protein [Humisphaera sp.]|nr:neutral/alkaline non-lysosomal ceramidase N-terminal domain-containing protein [Humisphaera sp.]
MKTSRRFGLTLIAFFCASVLLFGSRALAQEADWQVGIAQVKITPSKPVTLAGYAARTKPFETVDQNVYATAMALQDRENHRAVLITLDLTILPGDVAEGVRSRIIEKQKLEPAQVVLSVSHTHSAPTVSLSAGGGVMPTGNVANTIEYTRELQDKIVAVADEALAKMSPAKLSWGWGVANFVMNRRQFTDRGIILGVNPAGPVDRTVPVLRIDGPDGTLRGVLFGYACHNTTMPSNMLAVSGDYAGHAKAFVQKQFPGTLAMFMMGCGGDANPYPREQAQYAVTHGQELGEEVCRVLKTKLTPVHGPLGCAQIIAQLPLETPDEAALTKLAASGPSLIKPMAQQMLKDVQNGDKLPAAHAAPVCAWQFGKDLTLVQLPEEVTVGYVHDIQQSVGPLRLWVSAYCNEVAGYVPTRQILSEGGYEARGLYVGNGWFAPGVEETLTNAARDATVKAGRTLP